MKKNIWLGILAAIIVLFALRCGSGDRQHLNDNPNDLGMPDSATYSDSPMPGQPNGYEPAGSSNADSADASAVDSATMGSFQ